MLFWTIAILMLLAAAWVILRPLLGAGSDAGTARENPDVAVYRDQLKELDADVARGVLSTADAEPTRAEIGRRLLAAASTMTETGQRAPRRGNAALIPVLVAVMAFGSLGIYAALGNPGMPDQPLASRDPAGPPRPSQAEAVARMADALAENRVTPSPRDAELLTQLQNVLETRKDPRGFGILAQSLISLRDYPAAAAALSEVVTLKGDQATAADFTNLAEVMVYAAGGYVSPEAEDVLAEALQRDITDRRARYYSGLALAQGGKPELAMSLWAGLINEGPPDAPWKADIREDIRQLAARANLPLPEGMLRGPTQEDIEAASDMAAEDRMEMIRGMVSQLEDRLATEGGDASEWARLIRSLTALGETDRAATIAAEARDTFAGNAAALAVINAAGAPE